MEPNRNKIEGCADSYDSIRAYTDYHSVIQENFTNNFILNGDKKYQQALLIDIHGNAHKEDWSELGYTISIPNLNKPVLPNTLKSTIQTLFDLSSFTLDELIRGRASLGHFMEKDNFKSIPSPANLSPFGRNYFNGGFIVYAHGIPANRLNAIQVELSPSIRKNRSIAASSGTKFANSVFEFYNFHSFSKLI